MAEDIKIDKLDETFNIRIPSCIKSPLQNLSPEHKKSLNLKILKLMAEEIHLSRLNYSDILSSGSTDTL